MYGQKEMIAGNFQSASGARVLLRWLSLLAVLVLAGWSGAASAQSLPTPPPIIQPYDKHGVNLSSGDWLIEGPSVSIGPLDQGGINFQMFYPSNEFPYVSYSATGSGMEWQSNWASYIQGFGYDYSVVLMGQPIKFQDTSGTGTGPFLPMNDLGASLTFNGTTYTYTGSDGTVATFTNYCSSYYVCSAGGHGGTISTLTYPNGLSYTFTWRTTNVFLGLLSINNNLGYQIKINYACDTPTSAACYKQAQTVIAMNNAVDYCPPAANACTGLTQSWPTLTIVHGSTADTVTDSLNNTYTAAISTSGSLTTRTITYPSLTRSISFTRNDSCTPTTPCSPDTRTVVDGSGTWTYDFDFNTSSGVVTVNTQDPLGDQSQFVSGMATGQPSDITIDPSGLNLSTTYSYDSYGRVASVLHPEGNSEQYTYNNSRRGNLTQIDKVAKPGSGTPTITLHADFPSTCPPGQERVCNQPTSTTDGNGNVTNYTYDAAHGGVLTVTQPSVTGGNPQTRYSYTALQAWYKDSSGNIVAAPAIYKLTSVSKCLSNGGGSNWGSVNWGSFNWSGSTSCIGTAQEQLTTNAYAPGNSSTASNLQLTSVAVAAGDSSVSSTTSMTYDSYGNVATTTGPISGSTSAAFYDLNRRVIGTVAPDPDGSGPLLNPATSIAYEPDGQVAWTLQGTATGISYSAWSSSFTMIQQVAHGYDAGTGFLKDDTLTKGSTTVSLTWYSMTRPVAFRARAS